MEFKIFKETKDSIIAQNNSLRYTLAVLASVIAVEAVLVVWLITHQKTIFMPPANITKEFWIDGDSVSKSYLEMTSTYVADKTLNLTPETAKRKMSALLPIVESKYYDSYKTEISKQSSYISANGISQTFYEHDLLLDKPGVMSVTGVLKSEIGGKIVSTRNVYLNIPYKISAGQIKLGLISLKDSTEQFKKEDNNESK